MARRSTSPMPAVKRMGTLPDFPSLRTFLPGGGRTEETRTAPDGFDARALVDGLQTTFDSGRTRPLAWRLSQLKAMRQMIVDNRPAWLEAIKASTLRPEAECQMGDLLVAEQEINTMISNLASWEAPEHVPTPVALMPASSRVEKQPYGVALIIGPCNYPMQLSLCPLAGAIAAGNTAVLKPSELCPHVAELTESLIKAYLDPDAVEVVCGGKDVVGPLLAQKWGHIVFTGSSRVGKIVAAAAAQHLTPVTLELGGKCPVIVDPRDGCREPLASIASKLLWGRFFAGGQSCIAPEYVLAPQHVLDGLVKEFVTAMQKVHGDEPKQSAHLGRVSCAAAAERIGSLLVGHGGTVVCGGTCEPSSRYVAPTLIVNPREDSPVMNEEVFGPVLCFVAAESVDEAVKYVKRRPGTPLALYGFTSDATLERELLDKIPSGNALFNDVLCHFANPFVPFGGLGTSGNGALHGKHYFEQLQQKRGVMTKGSSLASRLADLQVVLRAPPYNPSLVNAVVFILLRVPFALPARYGYKALGALLLYLAWCAISASGMHVVWLRYAAQAVLDATAPEAMPEA